MSSETAFPINPQPDCAHCGGTGFARQHRSGYDLINVCQCNIDRLNEELRQRYALLRW
jgi:hypothetical protein